LNLSWFNFFIVNWVFWVFNINLARFLCLMDLQDIWWYVWLHSCLLSWDYNRDRWGLAQFALHSFFRVYASLVGHCFEEWYDDLKGVYCDENSCVESCTFVSNISCLTIYFESLSFYLLTLKVSLNLWEFLLYMNEGDEKSFEEIPEKFSE
jgi:hypothetical protein